MEPVAPVKPTVSETAKFELIKAMGVAIAAIAKEKGVFITLAEVNGEEPFELTIKCVIPEDKKAWDTYQEERSKWNNEWNRWKNEEECKKYGITELQRKIAETNYYEHRKSTGYKYPELKSKEEFYAEESEKSQKQIIEVA